MNAREPENRSFDSSPLPIPERFRAVAYNGARYPGAPGVSRLDGGANCQQFAYELLRHFGFAPLDLRSSDLWDDRASTEAVAGEPAPCDLLLFNRTPEAWGAHVAVYLGGGLAIHLSQRAGVPAIWKVEEFALRPEYACFIGAKRVRRAAGERVDPAEIGPRTDTAQMGGRPGAGRPALEGLSVTRRSAGDRVAGTRCQTRSDGRGRHP